MKLAVPHFKQTAPYTCLPACARMVLAYHQKFHSEQDLSLAFKTVPLLGTLPENVVRGIEKLGYKALWFENATFERIVRFLDHGWPPIVFVRATDLPHGTVGLHAVVVIGFESEQVVILDPVLDHPFTLSVITFLDIWSGLDHQGIVIWI